MKKILKPSVRKIYILFSVLFLVLFFRAAVLPKFEFTLNPQYMCTMPPRDDYSFDPYMTYWATIKDDKYESWYGEYGSKLILDYIEQNGLNPDTSKYTYIVVYQYDLDSMTYSFGRMNYAYTQFVGRAYLSNYEEGKTNIYRIRKMNLDSTYKGIYIDSVIDGEPQTVYAGQQTD